MKKLLKWSGITLLSGLLFSLLQMTGIGIGLNLLNATIEDPGEDFNMGIFLLTGLINAAVLLYYTFHSNLRKWRLATMVFLLGFGYMYFMTQIESLWFINSLKMDVRAVWGLMLGGLIHFILLSPLMVLFTGKFSENSPRVEFTTPWKKSGLWLKLAVFALFIWPFLYFIAGYTIPWQWEEVRMYYTGESEIAPFSVLLTDFFSSGLYLFQVVRGVLWMLLGYIVLSTVKGPAVRRGLVLAFLMVILCNVQLLLDNPIMPYPVRMAHLIETMLENTIAAVIITWLVNVEIKNA